jgi:hypothetical protein
MADTPDKIAVAVWKWLKENDIPNWIILLFTAIVWPIVLYFWQRKKINNIPKLEVRLCPANIQIDGNKHNAVDIEFINHTGSVVYLTGARIRNVSRFFSVSTDASRDIAENSHHLNFMDDNGNYKHREITLQTNLTAKTCIAVNNTPDDAFYKYSAGYFRRKMRFRKYFILEYTAMVGPRKYEVATVY